MAKQPWYIAEYRTPKGTPYYPTADQNRAGDDVRCVDCPVAVITPKTEELLNMFGRASRVHDASGASMFGPVLADWPIWAVDAQDQIRVCEIQESNARIEAEMMER